MNKGIIIGLAGLVLAGCAGVAVAQNAAPETPAAAPAPPPGMPQPITMARRPNASGGEALYVEYCIMCHGPNGMGTGLLQRAGRPQPLLEARGGLPAQFISHGGAKWHRQYARHPARRGD